MKSLATQLISIAGLVCLTVAVPIAASSQSQRNAPGSDSDCYYVKPDGTVVDLGRLCGEGGSLSPNRSSNSNLFTVRPKRRDGGTLVLDVKFNGVRNYEMILDTGASITLINREMARALGVRPVSVGRFKVADDRVVELPIGYVRSVSVGGATVNNVEVAISDGGEVGLLGQNFLNNFDIKIKQDVLELYRR